MVAANISGPGDAGERRRAIGPIGTVARLATGIGLMVLAVLAATRGDLQVYEVLLGVIGLPVIVMATVLTAKPVLGTSAHLNATGPVGTSINCATIVALFVLPWTTEIAYFFYGIPMFLAAWRGYPGCEMMTISNYILRRKDELGCPWFWPVDAFESSLTRRDAQAC